MAPPEYKEIGKNAEDVIDKGQYYGLINLSCKTKTDHTEVKIEGKSEQETGKVEAMLESRHTCQDIPLTFAESWNTDNVLGLEVFSKNSLVEGLTLGAKSTINPNSGKYTALLNAGFANDCFNICAEGKLKENEEAKLSKEIDLTATIEQDGWVGGCQGTFNIDDVKFTNHSFVLGFIAQDWEWFSHITNANNYRSTLYQKINPKLDAAVTVNWDKEKDEKLLVGACRYSIDQDATVAVNVNSNCQVGLIYQQRLSNEVLLSFSTLIDGMSSDKSQHKVGLGLDIEI